MFIKMNYTNLNIRSQKTKYYLKFTGYNCLLFLKMIK